MIKKIKCKRPLLFPKNLLSYIEKISLIQEKEVEKIVAWKIFLRAAEIETTNNSALLDPLISLEFS